MLKSCVLCEIGNTKMSATRKATIRRRSVGENVWLAQEAGLTSRAKLLALVTGAVYRHPGILAKTVTTLDVLSGGRAWLGIGAAWNEEESRGLGIPFPPVAERFERLEETLQICLQMWRGDETPYQGRHFQLERPLNSPQALHWREARRGRKRDVALAPDEHRQLNSAHYRIVRRGRQGQILVSIACHSPPSRNA